MDLIIISKRNNGINKLTVNSWWLTAFILLLLLISMSAFYAGSYYSLEISSNHTALRYQHARQETLNQLNQQKIAIENAKQNAQENLDALATRLSKLQGHIMRLDALGARLATMAKLDDINFNVNEPLGMGGPHNSVSQSSLEINDFVKQLEYLGNIIDDRSDKLSAMEALLMNYHLQDKTQPDGSPIEGGWISSLFGWRTDPILGRKMFHEGIDFAGKPDSLVSTVATGIVTWSGRHKGYGNMIEVSHGNGFITRYAHNKENLVSVGEKVDKGQVIAIIGSSGRSTGTHVHFEVVHNGKHVNPRKFIPVD